VTSVLLLGGPVRAETLAVDGGSLYYDVTGRGPAVVLVHGGFGDHRMWNAQWEALGRDFRVVRYDHRGFGRSTRPGKAYSAVSDLVALMDHLGIQTASLVGNSMGGTLAIDFTLRHPARVERLVVVASGADGFPIPPDTPDEIGAVVATARKDGTRAAAERWLTNPMVKVTSRAATTRDLLRQMVVDNREVFLMDHWPEESNDPKAAARLSEIKAPTLVILGAEDAELVLTIGKATAKAITGSRLEVLEGADHLPQMDAPAKVNALLREFLTAR
jgi:pimeloyl-ACP methyl ester carboxylesterase